jgi:hypothetical protein
VDATAGPAGILYFLPAVLAIPAKFLPLIFKPKQSRLLNNYSANRFGPESTALASKPAELEKYVPPGSKLRSLILVIYLDL